MNQAPMIFETERLIVRQLVMEDLPLFHEMQSSFAVMQYATGKAQSYDENVADISRVIAAYNEPGNTFRVWAIDEKSTRQFAGTVALVVVNGENDLGYRLRESQWGRGYGAEIAEGLIKFAFETLELESVVGVADVKNTASIKILQKLMDFEHETYNPELDCVDRAYRIRRSHWGKELL